METLFTGIALGIAGFLGYQVKRFEVIDRLKRAFQ